MIYLVKKPMQQPPQRLRPGEREALALWIQSSLGPWTAFFTGTFEGEFSQAAACRAYERFMKKHYPKVTWFYCSEKNPNREGHHVHGLIYLFGAELRRDDMWKRWFDRFGRCKVEPIRSQEDVSDYVTKHLCGYLVKGDGWWNFQINDPELWARLKAS